VVQHRSLVILGLRNTVVSSNEKATNKIDFISTFMNRTATSRPELGASKYTNFPRFFVDAAIDSYFLKDVNFDLTIPVLAKVQVFVT
jgi:hypothetical protein